MAASKRKSSKAAARSKYSESESSGEESYSSGGGSSVSGIELNSDKSESFFFACELSSERPNYVWDHTDGMKIQKSQNSPNTDDESMIDPEDKDVLHRQLSLQQICLGPDAKPGERNIVAVETFCNESHDLKTIPVASLTVGVQEMSAHDMSFHSELRVTLKLISGSGPVFVSGILERELEYNLEDLGELTESPENLNYVEEPSEEAEDEEQCGEDDSMEQDEPQVKQKEKKKKTTHGVQKNTVSLAKKKLKAKRNWEKVKQQISS